MPTYTDYGGSVISIIAGWFEVIADRKSKNYSAMGSLVRKIARVLGYTSHIALNTYINKRGLHQTVQV
jgi:hypothetical protein